MPYPGKIISHRKWDRAKARYGPPETFSIMLNDGEPDPGIYAEARSPSPNGSDSWEKAQANRSAYIRYANRHHGIGMPGSPLAADSASAKSPYGAESWAANCQRIAEYPLEWEFGPQIEISDEEFAAREGE